MEKERKRESESPRALYGGLQTSGAFQTSATQACLQQQHWSGPSFLSFLGKTEILDPFWPFEGRSRHGPFAARTYLSEIREPFCHFWNTTRQPKFYTILQGGVVRKRPASCHFGAPQGGTVKKRPVSCQKRLFLTLQQLTNFEAHLSRNGRLPVRNGLRTRATANRTGCPR